MSKSTDNLVTQLLDASQMEAVRDQWQKLSEHSHEDNVYYSPTYALALINTVDRNSEVIFVTVWREDTLLAVMPVTRQVPYFPGVIPGARAWQSIFTLCCHPLIDRNEGDTVTNQLVSALGKLHAGDWVIPELYLDGPVFGLLQQALEFHEFAWRAEKRYHRAFLEPGISYEDHMKSVVKKTRRKDLNRCRRRLEELGEIGYENCSGGPKLKDAVNAFLNLEAKGWKGKRGTALACNPDTQELARLILKTEDGMRCRADVLTLNGKPAAAGVMVFCGTTGFTVKGAYDEALSTYSPGLLLELEIIKSLLDEKWVARLDLATAGNHVIDTLWPGRRSVGDLSFNPKTLFAKSRLSAFHATERLKREGKIKLKRLINKFG